MKYFLTVFNLRHIYVITSVCRFIYQETASAQLVHQDLLLHHLNIHTTVRAWPENVRNYNLSKVESACEDRK